MASTTRTVDWAEEVNEAIKLGELPAISITTSESVSHLTSKLAHMTLRQTQPKQDGKADGSAACFKSFRGPSYEGYSREAGPHEETSQEFSEQNDSGIAWAVHTLPEEEEPAQGVGMKLQHLINIEPISTNEALPNPVHEYIVFVYRNKDTDLVYWTGERYKLRPKFRSDILEFWDLAGATSTKPKKLDSWELLFSRLPMEEKGELWSHGIKVKEVMVTEGELQLLDDERLCWHRCRPSSLRRSYAW